MSALYHQSFSQAENPLKQILLIHGWGMNSGIWSDLAPRLARQLPEHAITVVDLPGYGKSPAMKQLSTSASLAEALRPLLKQELKQESAVQNIIVGWSMGGLVAIELASQCKHIIQQLLLISSTPRFVQGDNWPDAVEAPLFQEFSTSLQKDHRMTLKRFLAIQTLGSPTAKEDIKKIQQQLSLQGDADPQTLQQGLQILQNDDKRQQLASLSMPVTFIAGQRDTLIKISALEQLAVAPNTSLHTIKAAGHAPFISHPQQFVDVLLKAL